MNVPSTLGSRREACNQAVNRQDLGGLVVRHAEGAADLVRLGAVVAGVGAKRGEAEVRPAQQATPRPGRGLGGRVMHHHRVADDGIALIQREAREGGVDLSDAVDVGAVLDGVPRVGRHPGVVVAAHRVLGVRHLA